jgi:hypothetical protein
MSKSPSFIGKAEREHLHFVRWVLFMLVASEASGLGSLTRDRLHAMLFMSFSSSRFYGIHPLRQRARRTNHGPHYRAAHVALGVLTLAGLVDVEGFGAHVNKKELQFEGTFTITAEGLRVAAVLQETLTGARLYRFILDLCLGSVSAVSQSDVANAFTLDQKSQIDGAVDKVLEQDLTYQEAIHRPGDSLFIEETEGDRTPTVTGLIAINKYLQEQTSVNAKDVLGAYQRLLLKRAA